MAHAPTAEQLRSKLTNRAWRLSNLYTILAGATEDNPGGSGLTPYQPNLAQRRYHNARHARDAILKARKLGLSTHKAIEFADAAVTTPNITLGIIDYTLPDATEKLRMVRTAWQHLDNGDLHPQTWRLGQSLKKQAKLVTDNEKLLEWSNGARLGVSTSFRGRTPNKLHLSEFGKISAFRPRDASEIVNGAFNSVLPGQEITSESTHEPGVGGEHEKLLRSAMANEAFENLTSIDWKFHFFAWHQDPRYAIEPGGRKIRPEIVKYFADLQKHHGITLNPAQMFWYDVKQQEQGYGMKKEFPSTPGEAFEAMVKGAIWGREIADLRAAGRVTDLAVGPEPLFTFWDLGYSDYTAIWLIQIAGRDVLVHNYHANHRLHTGRYAEVIRAWERHYDTHITHHYLPHDAESHGGGGVSPLEMLVEAGIPTRDVTVVPRSQDPWVDINNARALLARAYFHSAATDQPILRDQVEHPSGLACLENYRTSVVRTTDFETNVIVHDEFSHPADAFRTFAAADLHGLIRHGAGNRKRLITPGTQPGRYSATRRR